MFLLTKNQLEQIRKYIATYGIRTTDFPDTPTVTADDYVAIVQGGVNKKVKLSDLFDESLLPSLIIDINVKDDWDEISSDDHDSALSARLGLELKDLIDGFNINVVDNLNSYSGTDPLSANQGRILKGLIDALDERIDDSLTVVDNLDTQDPYKALSANMGYELNRRINLRPNVNISSTPGSGTSSPYYTLGFVWQSPDRTESINIYSKEQIDAILSGYSPTPGPGGSSYLYQLQDVMVTPSSLVGGEVLQYSGTDGKWVAGTVASTDTWRPIKVGADTLGGTTIPLTFRAGLGIGIVLNTSTGEITITNTGGDTPSVTGGYIGTTEVQGQSDPQALTGLTLIELVSSGSRKIYFGDSNVIGTPYLEWDTDNSCFHFSHGLYSNEFISAGGYNNAGAGANSLGDLSDVTIGTLSPSDDGKVLTYDGTSGKWMPKPSSGGSGGSSSWGNITGTLSDQTDLWTALNTQANWNELDTTSMAYIKNKPNLASVATSGSYSDLSNKPSAVLYTSQSLTSSQQSQARSNIGAGTYSKPNGGIPLSDMAFNRLPNPYSLKLGPTGYDYFGDEFHQFDVGDLTNIIGTSNGSYIRIGDAVITYNSGALYFTRYSGGNLNMSASGAITAGA